MARTARRRFRPPRRTHRINQPAWCDGPWEYRCSVRLFPGALRLKVEAFCEMWGGRMTHQAATSFCFHLPLGKKRSWWGLNLAKQPRLEVGIAGTAPPGPISPVSEV